MEERPDELSRHVLQAEFEVRVLVHRVVPGIEGQCPDRIALTLRDFARVDHPGRVARAGGRNGAIERNRRRITESDPWGRGGQHGEGIINRRYPSLIAARRRDSRGIWTGFSI